MGGRCAECLLSTVNISDRSVMEGWAQLSEQGDQSSEGILGERLDGLGLEQQHALALCYISRVIVGSCVNSTLSEFANADFVL